MGIIKFVADKLFANDKEMVNVEHKGLATAWVNFDGTSAVGTDCTIRDSYNINRVEHTAAGFYTIHFSSSMNTLNYILSGTAESAIESANAIGEGTTVTRTVDVFGINVLYPAGSGINTDSPAVQLIIHGGKN
jgi:hypothetical protein